MQAIKKQVNDFCLGYNDSVVLYITDGIGYFEIEQNHETYLHTTREIVSIPPEPSILKVCSNYMDMSYFGGIYEFLKTDIRGKDVIILCDNSLRLTFKGLIHKAKIKLINDLDSRDLCMMDMFNGQQMLMGKACNPLPIPKAIGFKIKYELKFREWKMEEANIDKTDD